MSTPNETILTAQAIHPHTTSGTEAIPPPTRATANPEDPPWGVPSALATWLVSIALLAIVPNLCVLPYVAYRYQGAPVVTKEILLSDRTFVLLFVSGWVPAHLLTLALVWAVATRLGKFSLREVFGLSWPSGFGAWKSVGLAIALFLVAMLLISLFGAQKTDLDRILESSRAAALTLAFIAVATAPLAEEFIYRGLLYAALQRAIGPLLAVVVVASMFAGLHVLQYWPNVGAITSVTLLSVVLTIVRARTGRLLPCVAIHLVFNGVTSLIIIFEPYLRALFEAWRQSASSGTLTYLQHFLD